MGLLLPFFTETLTRSSPFPPAPPPRIPASEPTRAAPRTDVSGVSTQGTSIVPLAFSPAQPHPNQSPILPFRPASPAGLEDGAVDVCLKTR